MKSLLPLSQLQDWDKEDESDMSGRDEGIEDPFEADDEPVSKPSNSKKRGAGSKGGKAKKQKTGGQKKRK
jgi:hypothetical protein